MLFPPLPFLLFFLLFQVLPEMASSSSSSFLPVVATTHSRPKSIFARDERVFPRGGVYSQRSFSSTGRRSPLREAGRGGGGGITATATTLHRTVVGRFDAGSDIHVYVGEL